MTHRHKETRSGRRHVSPLKAGRTVQAVSAKEPVGPRLEVVLKCDSEGSLEAASTAISEITPPGSDIAVIRTGLGSITKSDLFAAETAGRLVVGFQVDLLPGIESAARESGVEVRLYNVIYTLTDDLKTIVGSIAPPVSEEEIIGSARVIALFKGGRRGIIPGCQVNEGRLAVGQRFRIISEMGPVYTGTIESLHIGDHAVQTASPGEHVGIRIRNFNKVKAGDILESFRIRKKAGGWKPAGGVIRK